MRINKFLAQATGLSRRAADAAITSGMVHITVIQRGQGSHSQKPAVATTGQDITATDRVTYQGKSYTLQDLEQQATITIILHKPIDYVVSRNGQGSHTIYDLLPTQYQQLKPVGRLDKDSSGLLLLTNNGQLAQELTHPSRQKIKQYIITTNKPLQPLHRQMISEYGLQLDDGLSKLHLERIHDDDEHTWQVTMHEGRNRQIRRTFAALGYTVVTLHRTRFGDYTLGALPAGKLRVAH